MTPASAVVQSFTEAAIVSDQNVRCIGRIEDDGVVVDVDLPRHTLKGFPGVSGDADIHIDCVYAIRVVRVRINLAVVLRIHDLIVALLNPCVAVICGTEEAAVLANRRDQRINDIRILRRNAKRDATRIDLRDAVRQFRPRRAAIYRFEDRGLGPAGNLKTRVPPALVRRRIDDVWVPGVENSVGYSRVLTYSENGFPGLA